MSGPGIRRQRLERTLHKAHVRLVVRRQGRGHTQQDGIAGAERGEVGRGSQAGGLRGGDVLGLDPMYVANEGKLVAIVAQELSDRLLARMREHPLGRHSAIIGEVVEQHAGMVLMKTSIGGTRVVDVLFGEQLPRIC